MIETMPAIGTTMSVVLVDPNQATEWLENAAVNRATRSGKIDQYARDMLAGRWFSSVLRFDESGRLVDGQHRLWAVVMSGSSQAFYVERGLPSAAVSTIDSGIGRTVGDILAIRGEPNAITLASTIRYARWFETSPGRSPSGQSAHPFSPDEIFEYLDANREIYTSVTMGKRLIKSIPFPSASIAAALHYLESKRDAAKADAFWEQMTTGLEMRAGTGPYLLRRQILVDAAKGPGNRLAQNPLAALSIKAWNLWEAGKDARQLRWVKGPQQQEAFPRLGARPTFDD